MGLWVLRWMDRRVLRVNPGGYTGLHVATIGIAALLAGVGVVYHHCSEVLPIAAMIIGGVFGHAQGQKGKGD